MEKPKRWRNGQMMFNFLEWLNLEKGVHTNQNQRLADTFHLSDEDWDSFWKEYCKLVEAK